MLAKVKVVGSSDCQIDDILFTIRHTVPANFYFMLDRWHDFARRLHIPIQTINSIHKRLLLKTINLEETLCEILTDWTTRDGDSATMDILMEALEAEAMFSYSGALRSKFCQNMSVDASSEFKEELFVKQVESNLPELVNTTRLNVPSLLYLFANDILNVNEVEHLRAIRSNSLQIVEFYRIVQKQPDCYEHLLKAFSEQTDVLKVLMKFSQQ